MNAIVLSLLSILAVGPSTASSDPAAVADDVVMNAMRDELLRTKDLQLPKSKAPYFAAYTAIDLEMVSVRASFGALVDSSANRGRMLTPTIRVGDHEQDALGYVMGDTEAPYEDNYEAIRKRLWLSTDGAYKSAATNYRELMAQQAQRTRDEDAPDAFSKEESVIHLEPATVAHFDRKAMEEAATEASAVFREYPDVQDSDVSIGGTRHFRRFASTEGTLVTEGRTVLNVTVSAEGQAEDGEPIHVSRYIQSLDGTMPPKADVIAAAKSAAEEILELRKAPVLDDYAGPLLFEGLAGAQIAAHMIGPQFTATGWGMDLEARMGQRVLPKGFSVIDDPAMTELDGTPVIGTYAVDDEGVKAERVVLVDDGKLTGLLSTRKPTKKHPESNGHARGGNPMWASPAPSNMVLRTKKGLSDKALEAKLIKQMKADDLEFAIVVTDIGDSPWSPTRAYRVDNKGKRERVRLGHMEMLELRAFRDVQASKSLTQFDFMAMGGNPAMGGMGGMLAFTAPTTVAAPSLLIKQVVLHKNQGDKPKPPIYPHPFFATQGKK